ncbi:hypothetical protein HY491_00380 [Candidatus Woesearchaeota archaeon]|nr:hypothetical protein [Candidatus Woesearchaeota archaeon]
MAEYDVLYLEDTTIIRQRVESCLRSRGLTCDSCGSLAELEERLPGNQYKVYLFDGKFPKEQGGAIELNFPKAVERTRLQKENPRIVLYSAEDDGAQLAARHNAEFLDKRTCTWDVVAVRLEEIVRDSPPV